MLLRAFVVVATAALLGGCVAAVPFAGQALDGIARQAMSAMTTQPGDSVLKDVAQAPR